MEQNGSEHWYINAARFFRGMGFFAKYAGSSDEELALRLRDDVSRHWDEPCPPGAEKDPQLADMYLLSTDQDRVWCADLECVYPAEHAYVRFLDGLAAISMGVFRPRDVTEQWSGERGPAEVGFTVGGKRYTFTHKGGDMLDPSVIRMINGAIKDTGIGFVVCDNFGMPSFILALKQDEMTHLAGRGWKFWPHA